MTSLEERVSAGLQWPDWDRWPDRHELTTNATPTAQSPPHRSARRSHQNLGAARVIADGGPYLELYDSDKRDGGPSQMSDLSKPPLDGIRFAIKDLFAVAGHPMTAASPARANAACERVDAPVVAALRAAGAVAVGSTTLHEFAFGVTGLNPHAGTAPNPAAPDRVPGGSSSGSASAVADGSANLALGTDTGGSVRIPAAFCGVVGFKPGHHTYSSVGVFPLSPTLDHVGLFANTVADVTNAHRVLASGSARSGELPRVADLRLAVARGQMQSAAPAVRDRLESGLDLLAAAGATLIDIELPDPEKVFVASTAIMFSEAAAVHEHALRKHRDLYGEDIVARLAFGATLSGMQVASAHRLRQALRSEVATSLLNIDAVIGPTVPIVAPLLADADDPSLPATIVANTRLANVVGLPAISIPLLGDGPPIGLQLLGANDDRLLATALAVERAIDNRD